MTDRLRRLDAARHLDWRFLLPTPELGRVALVGATDPEVAAALSTVAIDVRHGSVAELGGQGAWDLVLSDGADVRAAFELLRPGGWLLLHLPSRARWRRTSKEAMRVLVAAGAERIERHWYLPDRRRALRIASLDDRDAVRATMSRHGGRVTRRATVAAARGLVGAGVPADRLGGEAGLLARRPGGMPLSGWPSLEPLAATLATELGMQTPSWILLTPRFPASAHVVLLLLVGGNVRLVAKIARLAGDEGPRHEGRILEALAEAGIPAGAAPRFVVASEVAGHAVLVEEALQGRPLDRRLVRTDPARWIGAAVAWLANLPRGTPGTSANLDELVREPLERVRDARPDDRDLGTLVERTLAALAPLESPALPAVFEHGDLSHPNLLVRHDGGLGVLDWELARRDGLPLHDLCFYLEYVARATGGEAGDPFDRLERVLAHPTWGAVAALRSEAARLGLDRARLPALIAVCWARAFARQAELGSLHRLDTITGEPRSSRYYRLWEGAVDREAQLRDLLL
jgi:hypothetical protein